LDALSDAIVLMSLCCSAYDHHSANDWQRASLLLAQWCMTAWYVLSLPLLFIHHSNDWKRLTDKGFPAEQQNSGAGSIRNVSDFSGRFRVHNVIFFRYN
jgi:hypothetical protein